MGDIAPEVVTFVLYTVGTGAPADGPFLITFDFDLDAANVIVLVQEPDEDEFEAKVKDVDWTLDVGGSAVRFITTTYSPPTGTVVRIERHTDRGRVIDYEPGGTITATNLNDENNQEFFILQEIENDLERALFKDLTGSWWQGESLRSHNCGEATTGSGWTTLDQVLALIEDGDVTHLDGADVYSWLGDGETVYFELTGLKDIDPERIIVTINGLIQQTGEDGSQWEDLHYTVLHPDDTGYPGPGYTWDVLVMTNAPAAADVIEARLIKGTVIAQYRDGVIDADAIADCAIEERHICFRKTPASRMVFNPSSSPTFEDVTSISLFEASLDTWLAAKTEAAFTSFISQNLEMNNKRIKNLAAPSDGSDAARKDDIQNVTSKVMTFPNLTNTAVEKLLQFVPDIVFMTAQRNPGFESITFLCSTMFMFGRDTDQVRMTMTQQDQRQGTDGSMPAVTAKIVGTGQNAKLRLSIAGAYGTTSLTQIQIVAIKF